MYFRCFSVKLAALHRVCAWATTRHTMYEEHFGLSKNPFQSIAGGEAVFEGPERAKVIADLKTALTANDSIAVITGPVGVGKTTIVQRAMESMGPERLVAILGRSQVGSDELADLLLAQFGVVRQPTKRFECLKTFNRILNESAAAGARVFIVIEDAERLGAELLEELEALTAADGGACAGANIVLMGRQKLDKLITKPALERIRQRIRLQRTLEPFKADEVEAYLRHRIEAAGGDFDAIFEPGTSLMVRRCSGGIPRVINSLCETALTVAAGSEMAQVSGKTVFKVAVEVFGMSPGDAPTSQARKAVAQAIPPVVNPLTPAPQKAPSARAPAASATKPAQSTIAAKAPNPARQPTTTVKPPAPAATKPATVAKIPASVTAAAAAPEQKISNPTIPDRQLPSAAEASNELQQTTTPRAPRPPSSPSTPPAKPAAANGVTGPTAKANGDAARLPDLPGLGVQDKDTAAADAKPATDKPLPEPPPKFRFADEIFVDRDAGPKPPMPGSKTVDPSELPTLESHNEEPKIADEKPAAKKEPAPPSAAVEDIPTLGDAAQSGMVAPEVKQEEPRPAAKPAATAAQPAATAAQPAATAAQAAAATPSPAATPAAPTPADHAPAVSLEEPSPAAERSEPRVTDPTASFAKVDHDMLDAALASLAVHDEQDAPESVAAEMLAVTDNPAPDTPAAASIPEVTLDKSIEAKQAAAEAQRDPEELDRIAAELEKTQSLEQMSDRLAETLFGSEELEAISMHIREKAAPEEKIPVALESTESAGVMEPAAAPATPAPDVAKPTPAAAAQSAAAAPAAPKPPAAPPPVANVEPGSAAAPTPAPAAANRGPQPEPIENQFNTSMTATLETLNSPSKAPADDDDDAEESSGGLLGRLKKSFKS